MHRKMLANRIFSTFFRSNFLLENLLKLNRIRNFRKKTAVRSHVHGRKKLPMWNFLKVSRFIRK